MKIYIIGPSGGGKTYLADKLSQKLNLEHINLDYVFFKHIQDKNRVEVPEKEWKEEISRILKKKKWIIEGVNPVMEVLNEVDKVIYLRSKFSTALLNQWKRYLSDPKQRKEHGFINNLKLTRYLVKQYFQDPDIREINNPKYSRVRKTDLILKNFLRKTVVLETRKEVSNFLSSFSD